MANIYLVYSNSKLPLSPIIRWRTGAAFSHVGIILEDSQLDINELSIVSHSALSTKGVRFNTLKTFLKTSTSHRIVKLNVDITDEQFLQLVHLCHVYEGLKYDLKGAIGLGFNENWQEDDAFWCSEWIAFLFKQIGLDLKYLNDVHSISPKHCLEWPQSTIIKTGINKC